VGFEEETSSRRSGNSSGSRTPKKTSPMNGAPREPSLLSSPAGAAVGDGASLKASADDSSNNEARASTAEDDGEANSGATDAPAQGKSSFYFLSRLFGTFRRSTAVNATPRGSAVKIAIIHEAEFEDSDSAGSGSGKSTPTKEMG
jgi:hypothetical protein